MSGPYAQPLVYFFGQGRADGTAAMKDVLGGKGAGLAEMTTIGIPVPPGFTIASSLCLSYLESHQFPKRLQTQVENALHRLEAATGKHFGDGDNPLLVSVRSGAAGVDAGHDGDDPQPRAQRRDGRGADAGRARNPQFAWDSYRRFVQMYGSVVFELPAEAVRAHPRGAPPALRGRARHRPAGRGAAGASCGGSRQHVRGETGRDFPERPAGPALGRHRGGVRELEHPPGDRLPEAARHPRHAWAPRSTSWPWCSATWARTRAPASRSAATRPPASAALYGEYLLNAQGEDVVSGIRTPLPIATLKERLPASYQELERVARTLERHFRDVQDMEFTIERGTLYMLQTRRGQRSGHAAVRIACEMVDEELISEEEAVARIPPHDLNQLLHPDHRPAQPARPAHHRPAGLARARRAARSCSTPTAPRSSGAPGQAVILVRRETSPEDFHGMVMAKAVLTARGGMTCHAAVVARGMGKPCVVGRAGAAGGRAGGPGARVNGRTARRGRLDHGRRQHRQGVRRPGRAPHAGDERRLPPPDAVGRPDPPAPRAGQRRHAGRRPPRPRLRRRGHRALPHRAHVLRRRPPDRHARDDRRAGHRGPPARARQAAADAARRLRGHLPRDGGLPGHHPAARSAAARVPAARSRTRSSRWRASSRWTSARCRP